MTKAEVYSYLQKQLETTNDAEIARQLDINDRQKVKQWAEGARQTDITTAIMGFLISNLEQCHAKNHQ